MAKRNYTSPAFSVLFLQGGDGGTASTPTQPSERDAKTGDFDFEEGSDDDFTPDLWK